MNKGILTLEYLDRQLADINEGKYNGIIEKNTRMLNLISLRYNPNDSLIEEVSRKEKI